MSIRAFDGAGKLRAVGFNRISCEKRHYVYNNCVITEKKVSDQSHDSAIEELLNSSYSVKPGSSFYDDFPVWSPKLNTKIQRFASFEDGMLCGYAGLRLCQLKVHGTTLPIALIGGVATSENHRGKGIASRLTNMASDFAMKQNALAVFLWGSEHDLYRKLGFELCGTQLRMAVSSVGSSGAEFSPSKGFDPQILKEIKQRKWGVEVSLSDHSWYAKHKNVDWVWVKEGERFAFIGMNRGIDLQGFIHELGGDSELLKSLLAHQAKQNPNLQVIASPEIFKSYGFQMDRARSEYVCMGRVLNPNAIFETLKIADLKAETENGQWRLFYKTQSLGALDPSGMTRLIFGPDKIEGLPAGLQKYFPVSFWFWGLDSA